MQWKSFGHEDMIDAFHELEYEIRCVPFDNHGNLHRDEQVEADICNEIEAFKPDFVFSFSYFPVISNACNRANVKYISWIYDSPLSLLYSFTVINPCNIIFTFDKTQYQEFHDNGIETVHYLPLAANVGRLDKMNDYTILQESQWKNSADIAFIGSMYSESHQFYDRLDGISDYTRGYLEGLMEAQKKVYGYNFVQKNLENRADIVNDMNACLNIQPSKYGVESIEYILSQYCINRQITKIERRELLMAIGEKYKFDLYTPDENLKLKGAINHGKVDYYDMAPYVIRKAKINLNISLRSILSGIPLRCFDILGAGGFLLTNYQADFDDCYIPNEDYVYYESRDDLLAKIEYYLNHDDEREQIAINGHVKTRLYHTYTKRVIEMVSYL